jgi:tetratricopeptide (TPR) repeat protein
MSSNTPLMLVALLTLASALSTPAAAQTAEERELASALFRESAEAYQAGNFELSVTLLRRAYELDPVPVLQYNLARALEGMGDTEGAIETYERYLELDPDAEDRPVVEERLEALRADQERAQEATDAEAEEFLAGSDDTEEELPEGPMPPPRTVSPAPWIIAGVGVLLAGSAIATGVMANGRHDDALATDVHADRVRLADEADSLALVTNINLTLGGVFLLAGGIWGLVDVMQVRSESALTLRIGPGQLALRGRF